ncbi:MAG: 1-(5-phosphoribosyl)-5-[(5-phosphoribosylamino)methylideneamino]imidazole-4-carboxamide isomerase [Candidatus Omnitrophota bacterium]
MKIIPAVDLWEGKVVRLLKGDPKCSTVYSDDPVGIARKWKNQGAGFLHIVDLSAALGGKDNFEIIGRILKEPGVRAEVGGGIRSLEKAEKIISLGAERVIVGTKGLDKDFLKRLLKLLGPDRIAVSVDVIDSEIAVRGWQEKSSVKALDFIKYLEDEGLKWVIYTDICRDGTLEGVDVSRAKKMFSFRNLNITFGGGISCMEDIKKIKQEAPFIWGIITGKALYEGKIDLTKINIDNL